MYLLFAGTQYYAEGGWEDFISAHSTYALAMKAKDKLHRGYDWWQIVDTELMAIVAQQGSAHSDGVYDPNELEEYRRQRQEEDISYIPGFGGGTSASAHIVYKLEPSSNIGIVTGGSGGSS